MCVVDEFVEVEVWHRRLGHVNIELRMSITWRASRLCKLPIVHKIYSGLYVGITIKGSYPKAEPYYG
jgi:hypothetical protein